MNEKANTAYDYARLAEGAIEQNETPGWTHSTAAGQHAIAYALLSLSRSVSGVADAIWALYAKRGKE